MDQLRKALQWLKQNHFWVLSVLVMLIGIACWWSGSGTLGAAFKTNEQQIKAGFDAVAGLQQEPFHPNETIKTKQIEETRKQAENVKAIWQQLYDRQSDRVLVWPPELGEAFVKYVEKLEFGDNIDRQYRVVYQSYILNHFRALPDLINARDVGAEGIGLGGNTSLRSMGPEGPMSSPTSLEDDEGYICEWDAADQTLVRQDLEFQQQPSALRIWKTQEDLWVYKTLLEVIKNTNAAAGATRKSNAAVRIVHSLEVGQRAAPHSRTPNRIYQVPAAAVSTAEGEEPVLSPEGQTEFGAAPRVEFSPRSFGETGETQLSPEEEMAQLLTWRYLDSEGKPMGAVEGGGGAEASPEAAPVGTPVDLATLKAAEYKRLPIRMVLQMDLRYLPRLIEQCANQALQVEVQEVRINPSDVGGGSSGLGSGRSFAEGFGGGNMLGSSMGTQEFDPQPHIKPVVIQGVIYIFNKPNATLLETTPTGEQVADLP